MGRETSTQKKYVYTGPGAIRTEDGLRTGIEAGNVTSLPFVASVGWLKRHAPVRHLLKSLVAYEADKAKAKKAQPKETPTKAKAEGKPAKAAKKAPKKAPKSEE